MALTAAYVNVALTGTVSVAPSGTTLPNSPTTSLDAAFKDVGYLTEDGVTESTPADTAEIKAWQNGDIVRRVQTSHAFQLKFTMQETNSVTLAQFYGNYAAGVVQVKAGQLAIQSWAFDVLDGNYKKRIVVPNGQIVERGDVVNTNGGAITYPVTLECYPDSSAVKAYIYLATASVSA